MTTPAALAWYLAERPSENSSTILPEVYIKANGRTPRPSSTVSHKTQNKVKAKMKFAPLALLAALPSLVSAIVPPGASTPLFYLVSSSSTSSANLLVSPSSLFLTLSHSPCHSPSTSTAPCPPPPPLPLLNSTFPKAPSTPYPPPPPPPLTASSSPSLLPAQAAQPTEA